MNQPWGPKAATALPAYLGFGVEMKEPVGPSAQSAWKWEVSEVKEAW